NDHSARIGSELEVVRRDFVDGKLAGLQNVEPALLVNDSTVSVGGQKIVRIESVDCREIGTAFVSVKQFTFERPEQVVTGNRHTSPFRTETLALIEHTGLRRGRSDGVFGSGQS